MDNGLLMRTKNYESSNWLAFWAVQSAAQTKSIYVEKNVSNTPPHSGYKLQKPAKIRFKKKCEIDAIIIMLATVSQIFYTKHAHAMTGNGNCVKLA